MQVTEKTIDGDYIRYTFDTGHYGYVVPSKSAHLTLRGPKGGLINPSSKPHVKATELIKGE